MVSPFNIGLLLFQILLLVQYSIGQSAPQCGRLDDDNKMINFVNSDHRVVNGIKSEANKWPWVAQLLLKGRHRCGGVLIDENFILTAAHCFAKSTTPSDYEILLGNSTSGGGTRFNLLKFAIHDLYNMGQQSSYDVAIGMISPQVRISDDVRPICLPTMPAPNHQICVVAGWGALSETNRASSDILHEVHIPVLPIFDCIFLQQYAFRIHIPSMICAGAGSEDACYGDSGGPLMCLSNNQWEVQGLVSWGIGCGRRGNPGIYASVHASLPFINWQKFWLKNGI